MAGLKATAIPIFLFGLPVVASVPLSYATSGHPTVPTSISGEGPFAFVFDTGAEGTAVYSWFAKQRRLRHVHGKTETLQGQTGEASADIVVLPTLTVDGRTISNVEAVVLPDRADGVAIHGIVGLDLMGRHVVEFDAPKGRVALHDQGTSAKKLGGKRMASIRAKRLAGGLLGLPVSINGSPGIAVLDTGARDTRINWRFARAAGVTPESPGVADDGEIRGATNNAVLLKRGTFQTVDIGKIRRVNRRIRIGDLPVFAAFGVAEQPAMILGMDLLNDIHLVIDFPNKTVWMASKPGFSSKN
jgi:predicted aspartyl protease